MSDTSARRVILDVLDRAGAPGFLKAVLLNERDMPVRQALHMLPNYDDAVDMMNDALAGL